MQYRHVNAPGGACFTIRPIHRGVVLAEMPAIDPLYHSFRDVGSRGHELGSARQVVTPRPNLRTDDKDQPVSPVTTEEKIGLAASFGVMVIGLSAAEISLGILGIAMQDLGPIGVVFDVGVIAPIELLLIDVEISYARYVSEVFETGTKDNVNLDLTIYPAIIEFFKKQDGTENKLPTRALV